MDSPILRTLDDIASGDKGLHKKLFCAQYSKIPIIILILPLAGLQAWEQVKQQKGLLYTVAF